MTSPLSPMICPLTYWTVHQEKIQDLPFCPKKDARAAPEGPAPTIRISVLTIADMANGCDLVTGDELQTVNRSFALITPFGHWKNTETDG